MLHSHYSQSGPSGLLFREVPRIVVLHYYFYDYYYCVVFIKRTIPRRQSSTAHHTVEVSLVINFSSSRFVRRSSVITFLFPNTMEWSLSVKYFTTSKYSKLLLIYIYLCVYCATRCAAVSIVVCICWTTGQGNRVWQQSNFGRILFTLNYIIIIIVYMHNMSIYCSIYQLFT